MITVAVVDDQHLVRSGLAMLINSQPDLTVVAEAGSGTEAVASPAVRGADVVLMDVRMPGINGIEAFHEIRRQQPHPGVILMSGYPAEDQRQRVLEEGAMAFLPKPLNIESVLQLITSRQPDSMPPLANGPH